MAAIAESVAAYTATARVSLKRPFALSGISATAEERNVDFLCPVCFDLIREPTLTRCGHSFCYVCIFKSIGSFQRCPKCNTSLTSATHIFPNRLLGELIAKYERRTLAQEHMNSRPTADHAFDGPSSSTASSMAAAGAAANQQKLTNMLGSTSAGVLKNFVAAESEKLELHDVQAMLDILQERKMQLQAESSHAQNALLHEFLRNLLAQKKEQALRVHHEIDLVQGDLQDVLVMMAESELSEMPQQQNTDQQTVPGSSLSTPAAGSTAEGESVPTTPPPLHSMALDNDTNTSSFVMDEASTDTDSATVVVGGAGDGAAMAGAASVPLYTFAVDAAGHPVDETAGFNSFYTQPASVNLQMRKRRLFAHFDDFVQSYFSVRSVDLLLDNEPTNYTVDRASGSSAASVDVDDVDVVGIFFENMKKTQ